MRWLDNGLIDRPHGDVGTYTRYGCRCEACKAAKREYVAEGARIATDGY
jgi:hypothetical protein